MEGVHFERSPLLEPPPPPCGSVMRTGSPGGGGRLEPMVRDRHDAVAEGSGRAPRTLRQPVDASPPLGPISVNDAVASFRRVRAGRRATTRWSLRAWAGRISGRSDR